VLDFGQKNQIVAVSFIDFFSDSCMGLRTFVWVRVKNRRSIRSSWRAGDRSYREGDWDLGQANKGRSRVGRGEGIVRPLDPLKFVNEVSGYGMSTGEGGLPFWLSPLLVSRG
jgi:hypothetical protein